MSTASVRRLCNPFLQLLHRHGTTIARTAANTEYTYNSFSHLRHATFTRGHHGKPKIQYDVREDDPSLHYDDASRRGERTILGRYKVFPLTLFRVQPGGPVALRDYVKQREQGGWDICTENGVAMPLESDTWEGPNGATMRPNTYTFQEMARNLRGRKPTIFRIEKGTPIPHELMLIHETQGIFSLQCSEPMLLRQLDKALSLFLHREGKVMSVAEFMVEHPLFCEEDFANRVKNATTI